MSAYYSIDLPLDDDEVACECEQCGRPITNRDYHELPMGGGSPPWLICNACLDAIQPSQRDYVPDVDDRYPF